MKNITTLVTLTSGDHVRVTQEPGEIISRIESSNEGFINLDAVWYNTAEKDFQVKENIDLRVNSSNIEKIEGKK